MTTQTLKVGVIGVGGIARTHMPGWQASPHTEVIAGADIHEPALKEWGQTHNVGKRYLTPSELIANPEIDVVDICTPSAYHAELAIAALQAGKHVICEKPLAPTPEEIRKMIRARDKSGKKLMTAQHMRFLPEARALKAEIDAGWLGDIYHARAWMLRRAALPTRPSFVMKQHAGGGPCIDIGVHILDLTLWMMGNPTPVAVTGAARNKLASQEGAFSVWGGKVPREMDVEDYAVSMVRFDNGTSLVLEVSWMLHHDTQGANEDKQMWLYGTKAGSHWPSCRLFSANNETEQHTDMQLTRTSGGMEPHAAECVAFAEAIVNDAPSPVPAEQSLNVQTILNGLYQSEHRQEEIRLAV